MNRFSLAVLALTVPLLAGCVATPLNKAIKSRSLPEVQRLVESGADVNELSGLGTMFAPLPQAVIYSTPEIVTYLVKKGARHHNEALNRATWLPRLEMLDALIDAGVDPDQEVNVHRYKEMVESAMRRRTRSAPPSAVAEHRPPENRAPVSDVDAPSRRAAERPDDFALVVGIEEYQTVPKADYGARDAATVKRHLEALGFPARNIVTLTGQEATASKLKSYLEEWLPLNVKANSTLFFYYSGHGAPDIKSGDAYLVPWDGDPKFLKSTALPLTRLYADLSKTKAKRVIVALDACFSGAGGRSVLAKGARPLIAKIADTAPTGGNLTVLAAASGDEITGSLDEQGHGMFTYHLLKGLSADPKASARSLFDYVMPRVQDDARRQNRVQTPVLAGAALTEPLLAP
ncbi:MAG: caspase family protein [Elusimicrobia bacterium]|nr:caspase family protein [Elusimicrobiota bacterium]